MAGWWGQGMSVKGFLGNLRLEPGRGAARKEARWVQGVEAEGCQVVLVAGPAAAAAQRPSCLPALSHSLASACVASPAPACAVCPSDAATADQNHFPAV